jgi:L-seryl-tRNA(Ser) seleniumtransferase
VINATGIILHTGLGRAPLSTEALAAINTAAENYCNLEIDLSTGERGERLSHVHDLLCELTGAEDAAVVNNNAAAVFLVLNTLSTGKEAVVSRGQLIEIGGSFRIPDIMARSGAIMVEVGTTNRTHFSDYKHALSDRTGLILTVHPSNYRVMGFTTEVGVEDLVALASEAGVPLMHDLGGGVLIDLRRYGLPYEPIARESLEAGVDVVMFSGDKVLGGPQAGIILGKKRYLESIKRNPLMRALRCDKLVYAALEATLRLYLDESTLLERHPTLRMMTEPVEKLRTRGERLMALVDPSMRCDLSLIESHAQTGSGALPLEELPSLAIAVVSPSIPAERLAAALRDHEPPIIGYVHDETLFLDLRTIRDDEVEIVARALNKICRA